MYDDFSFFFFFLQKGQDDTMEKVFSTNGVRTIVLTEKSPKSKHKNKDCKTFSKEYMIILCKYGVDKRFHQ